uniref:Uncharacterized protein n=1 Tax=Cucumis melo TaxID=3656 RepID=A0A9I9E3D9_CUCME
PPAVSVSTTSNTSSSVPSGATHKVRGKPKIVAAIAGLLCLSSRAAEVTASRTRAAILVR